MEHGRDLLAAEEAAEAALDAILEGGGRALWQQYLRCKAVPFAAEAACDALTSHLQMCFVAHDTGEEEEEAEEWHCPAEVPRISVDSWARMRLALHSQPRSDEEHAPHKQESARHHGSNPGSASATPNTRSRLSPETPRKNQMSTRGMLRRGNDKADSRRSLAKPHPSPRWFSIHEDPLVDYAEDRLREQKHQEEMRRRDREHKALLAEKAREEHKLRCQELHEEMARRPHNYDADGSLIWVEEVQVEELPKVMEPFPFSVHQGVRFPGASDTGKSQSLGHSSLAQTRGSKGAAARRRTRLAGTGSSTQTNPSQLEGLPPDGFTKLQYGQPPIIGTMNVRPGVVLKANGSTKSGLPHATGQDNGRMSRKDYIAWLEHQVPWDPPLLPDQREAGAGSATAASALSASGASQGAGLADSGASAASGAGRLAGGGGGSTAAGLDTGHSVEPETSRGGLSRPRETSLPPIPSTQRPPSARSIGSTAGGHGMVKSLSASAGSLSLKRSGTAQREPPAPAPYMRWKQGGDAVGHLARPPRLHIAPLGAQGGFRAPPPPLGATMGHGHISASGWLKKEAYYFPSADPSMQSHLRSSSETTVPPTARDGDTPSTSTSLAARESRHGTISPATFSSAYRDVRQAILTM